MKKILAALLALTLMLCLTACGDAEPETKTIYVQTLSVRTIADAEVRTEYTYGKTGRPVTMKMYFNGKLYQSVTNRISGGVTYMTMTDSDGNTSTQTTSSTYDSQGRVSILEINVGTTTVSRTNYSYTEDGKLAKASTLTANGTVTTEYTYDAKGNLATLTESDTSDNSYSQIIYTFNEENFVTEEKTYDQDGVLLSSIVYTYNSETTRTLTYMDGEGLPTGKVVTMEYDEHGNLIKEVTMENGEVVQTIINTYEAMEVPAE